MKLIDTANSEQVGWSGSEDLCCHLSCEDAMRRKHTNYTTHDTLQLDFGEYALSQMQGAWVCCGCGKRLRGVVELEVGGEEHHFL